MDERRAFIGFEDLDDETIDYLIPHYEAYVLEMKAAHEKMYHAVASRQRERREDFPLHNLMILLGIPYSTGLGLVATMAPLESREVFFKMIYDQATLVATKTGGALGVFQAMGAMVEEDGS